MKNRTLKFLLFLNLAITIGLVIYMANNRKVEIDLSNEILKVKGLVVTDSTGVARVIIGSHLPPAQSFGYRFYRGDNSGVSGVMLYDHEGQERGGYVTDDSYGNVFLTLDSKISQRVLFMAEPQGAATLKMWGKNANQINLGTSDDGTWMDVLDNGNRQELIKTDQQ
ncbi:hypothetical protein [Galbibacter pacificus]|uniref:Uncharacterized protein n=1 Tax=Galbibacter pacificus TaxID=2996052 RepID=A0ABT6FN78_9FLAO|nr:hypothetical protein [Galbibacter pacificus]MDG3581241.1 hypothetical protein [Galbibacter pacificus]MDG3584719.1 hypothetical protein [Galbibacter pacificus]